MMRAVRTVVACVAMVFAAEQVQAMPIVADPNPDDIAVLKNGIYYAWASPVATSPFGSNILEAPGFHTGWRYATAAELAARPTVAEYDLLPLGRAGAVPYWNSFYTHVDAGDYNSGSITSIPNGSSFDSIYVLDAVVGPAVPEPSSLALLATGAFGFVGYSWRRKRKLTV